LGRSRGGFGSKIHLVADGHGHPLAAHVTAGQINECTELETVVNRVRIGRRQRPATMAGDKAYSTPRIRQWLRRHAIRAVIPRRSDQHPDDGRVRFDRTAYRRRCTVEQCIGWLKECRRVATRFEKLAVNFLAMIHLAFIERYFRLLFSNGA
jgi:transposase